MLFSILGPSSLLIIVAQLDEIHANRTASVLEWYDRRKAYNIIQNLVQTKKTPRLLLKFQTKLKQTNGIFYPYSFISKEEMSNTIITCQTTIILIFWRFRL